jgi:glycosyltransferase involved in cell wall biosynthesis
VAGVRVPPEPAVSVVIATHDRRAWLEECIESVTRQAGVAFEVVVVDDASSDGTAEWLATVDDARVRSMRLQQPSERSAARNRGLAEARAPFVMFLDDDDWLLPGALGALASRLDAHPEAVAAVGARRVWFTEEGYQRRDSHPHRLRVRPILDDLLLEWSAVSGQNLYRTRLVREVGGYDETLVSCEDRDLWLRLAVLGPVVLCPETVMTYRVHAAQSRPPEIRAAREAVARRAIEALPKEQRARAERLRRTAALIYRAEDELAAGSPVVGVVSGLRAVASTPAAFASPLIGAWTLRRLGGRVARRIRPVRPPTT